MFNTTLPPEEQLEQLIPLSFDKRLLLLLSPVIIVLNGCIILMFVTSKSLRNIIANYFVCSYACSDILVGVLLIPTLVYGDAVAIGTTIMYTVMVSLLTLAICTYDRYTAVARPFVYVDVMTIKTVFVFILLTWIVPIFFSVIPVVWIQTGQISSVQNQIYIGFVIVVMLGVAITSITAYGIIFYIGRRHIASIIKTEISGKLDRRRKSIKRIKLEIKFVKLFAFLSISFALFWFPTCYINFIDNVLTKPEFLPPAWFQQVSFLWLLLSSVINPFVCGLFQQHFREVFEKKCYGCLPSLKKKRIHPNMLSVNRKYFDSDVVLTKRKTNRIQPINPDLKMDYRNNNTVILKTNVYSIGTESEN